MQYDQTCDHYIYNIFFFAHLILIINISVEHLLYFDVAFSYFLLIISVRPAKSANITLYFRFFPYLLT